MMVSGSLSTPPQKSPEDYFIGKTHSTAIEALIYRPASALRCTLCKSVLISTGTAFIRKAEERLRSYLQVTFLRLASGYPNLLQASALAIQVTPTVAFPTSLK